MPRKTKRTYQKASGLKLSGQGAIKDELTKQVVKEVLPFLVKESVSGLKNLFRKKKGRGLALAGSGYKKRTYTKKKTQKKKK